MQQEKHISLIKRFITIFLPLATLFFIIYIGSLMFMDKRELDGAIASEEVSIDYFGNLISSDFAQVESDLLTLAKLPSLINYSSNSNKYETNLVASYLTAMAIYKKKYDQIRFIDLRGDELIRVDYKDGNPIVVNKSKLQNKSSRYYFKETVNRKENDVFISSLDLNVENSTVEVPFKPVIRFGTPTFDLNGNVKGVVVINYLAENLRTTFLSQKSQMKWGEHYLVDENANIIFSEQYNLGDALYNIAQSTAENFTNIIDSDESQKRSGRIITLEKTEGLYLQAPLFDKREHLSTANAKNTKTLTMPFNWRVVTFVSNTDLRQLSILLSPTGIIQGLLMLMMIAFIAFILAKLWFNQQVGEIKRTKDAVDRQNEVETLIQTIPSGVVITDSKSCILQVNNEIERLFGYPLDELLGQPLNMLVPSSDGHIQGGQMLEFDGDDDFLGIAKNNNKFPVSATYRKVTTLAQEKVVVSIVDISQQVAKESELRQAIENAQDANKAKSLFLSTMSHEIRTPLNAIIGMLYLHQSTVLTPEQKVHVDSIKLASDKLLMLINDILDFSKIEAGEMRLENTPFMLSSVVDGLQKIFSYQAVEKGNTLNIPTISASQFPIVIGDSTRLGQILSNLLSNACKFTKQGTISLTVEDVTTQLSDKILLRFDVKDTGIGMSEDAQASLFDAFSQANLSINREYGGTGLGLSIVKRLTEIMHGSVSVTSTIGLGTKFSIEIPFEYTNNSIEHSPHLELNRPLSLLVADDEKIDRSVLIRQAEQLGWECESVSSGKELIEQVLLRQQQGHPVDCIVVDWQMPELNGLETIEILSEKIAAQSMPSVIMVTAHDKQELIKQFKDTKPDSVLTKPVKASYLFNSVTDAVIKHGIQPDDVIKRTTLSNIDALWLDGMHILVVDDSNMNLYVCENILKKHGAKVSTANSGSSAIVMLTKKPDIFDAILMDIQMPDMDGLEATKVIRQKLDLLLPVIALSAGVSLEERNNVASVGMNEFLSKPIEPERLLKVLIYQVNRYREKNSVRLSEERHLKESEHERSWPNIDGLDEAIAKLTCGDDPDFYMKMLNLFVVEQALVCIEIEELMNEQNFAIVQIRLHKIKGQAANLGFLNVEKAAADLEFALQEKASEVQSLYDRFQEIHSKLIHDIKGFLSVNN